MKQKETYILLDRTYHLLRDFSKAFTTLDHYCDSFSPLMGNETGSQLFRVSVDARPASA